MAVESNKKIMDLKIILKWLSANLFKLVYLIIGNRDLTMFIKLIENHCFVNPKIKGLWCL